MFRPEDYVGQVIDIYSENVAAIIRPDGTEELAHGKYTIDGRYKVIDYDEGNNEFALITEEDAQRGAAGLDFTPYVYYVEADSVGGYAFDYEEHSNPEHDAIKTLDEQYEMPSVEHPLGPHTGGYELDPLLKKVLEEQMREGGVPEEDIQPSISDIVESMNDKLQNKDDHKVIDMDHNSKTDKYEHKFENYKNELRSKGKKHHHGEIEKESAIDRASIPAEHLASGMSPEELEALLAGGEGKGWTDVPEADRPHGWGEEIVETPKGTEYKRIIDPDLERAEREEAHGLANKPFPTQGLRGASVNKKANDESTIDQLPFTFNGQTAYAFNVNIINAQFDNEEPNVVPYGEGMVTEPGTGGLFLTDFDVTVGSIVIDNVCYSADPNEAAKDQLAYGGDVTPDMLQAIKETIFDDDALVQNIEQTAAENWFD